MPLKNRSGSRQILGNFLEHYSSMYVSSIYIISLFSVEKSVNLFAHRLTMDNRRTLPQIESLPRPTKCQDRLIMVKFARLGLPLNKSLNYRTAAYIKK